VPRLGRTGKARHIHQCGKPRAFAPAHRQARQDSNNKEGRVMRGVLLWAVGIPIPVIILLYLFHVI